MRRRIGSLSLPHAISCSSHVRVSSKRVWTCSFMASLSSDFSIFRKPPLAMYRDIQRIENGSTVQKIEYLRYSSFFSSLFSPRLLQYSEISRKRACAYGIPYERVCDRCRSVGKDRDDRETRWNWILEGYKSSISWLWSWITGEGECDLFIFLINL